MIVKRPADTDGATVGRQRRVGNLRPPTRIAVQTQPVTTRPTTTTTDDSGGGDAGKGRNHPEDG